MANLTRVVRELRKQRDLVAGQVESLDQAITTLSGLGGRNHLGRIRVGGPKRKMSAAARRRIAAAQRARWAKWKALHRKKAA